MNEWSNFFVAMAGAAAALSGLIFVGVSINLTRILSLPKLPGRALESLLLLLTILIVSALCLVPAQSAWALGAEVLGTGIITCGIALVIDIGMLTNAEAAYKKHAVQNICFSQLSILPCIIAGITTAACGYHGIYWLVPGFLLSFIKAIIDAWVLLVEINR